MNKIILSIITFLLSASTCFSQAPRKVLFEEWTSATCSPCASNNPILDAYVESNRNVLSVIKYHVGWPAPGTDPMYLHNTTDVQARLAFYPDVNAVPWLKGDGVFADIWPFSNSNFQACIDARMAIVTPVGITVTDQRIAGDSIKATVTVTKLSALPAGTYYLRVAAIERTITYPAPPGTNGEMVFKDVFRKAFPDMQGTSITTTAGTQVYNFTYKRNSVWVDSMIYTVAFVQRTENKEVMNSNNGWGSGTVGIEPYIQNSPESYTLSQNYPNPFNPSTNISFKLPERTNVSLKIYNAMGQMVKEVVNGIQNKGTYNIYIDGGEFTSGIYFYTLSTSEFTDTKKMVLIK